MIKTQHIVNYFLLFMIIALTGFEFFFRDNKIIYFVLFPLSSFLFFYNKIRLNNKAVFLILLLASLLFIHSYKYNLPYSFVLTGLIRFTSYYFIAALLGVNFNKTFVNIVYLLACISLVFYAATNLSDTFYHFLLNIFQNIKPLSFNIEKLEDWTNPNHTLIIYTVPFTNIIRNSGPFWEPGMFAVFLNIALAINILKTQKLFEIKNVIFLITSITTLSTTSLIATFIILVYYYLFINRNIYSFFFIAVVFFIGVPVYNGPLIKGKIVDNLEKIDYGYSRFGAALVHFMQIKNSPWVGYGAKVDENQETLLRIMDVTPNGLTDIIRYYGIPFAILFYFLLFKFAQTIANQGSRNKGDAILLFIIILTVAFSQDVTTRHFYYILLFIPIANRHNINSRL